ncbi:hypothetical protein [Bacillus thuringiensis]|uniref:hypothetical protein n=1 Tax=Bacillus thuringiensis TaxID=1428 RepID=UPI002100E968|nr:hypothetical protein [Bacillus thuringiensis]
MLDRLYLRFHLDNCLAYGGFFPVDPTQPVDPFYVVRVTTPVDPIRPVDPV